MRLRADAAAIAGRFGLALRSLSSTRSDARLYGWCDLEGNIRVRLRSRTTGKPLRYSSLIATVCHELAHLRHFSHGPPFRSFCAQLLEHARARGVYRPAAVKSVSPSTAAPQQLCLFPPPGFGRPADRSRN